MSALKGIHTLGLEMDAERYQIISRALDEGRISIILEGARDSIDGGVIVTDMDEVLDFLSEVKE